MKLWIKIAAGVLGGLAIVASLGGFGKKKETRVEDDRLTPEEEENLLDGIRPERWKKRGNSLLDRNEENMRGLQDSFTKASNIMGHLSNIVTSLVKMFYDEPHVQVYPTTMIFR